MIILAWIIGGFFIFSLGATLMKFTIMLAIQQALIISMGLVILTLIGTVGYLLYKKVKNEDITSNTPS